MGNLSNSLLYGSAASIALGSTTLTLRTLVTAISSHAQASTEQHATNNFHGQPTPSPAATATPCDAQPTADTSSRPSPHIASGDSTPAPSPAPPPIVPEELLGYEVLPPFLFILGAGASVSSGLRTYRGPDGMYPKDVEQVLCPDMLYAHPERVWAHIGLGKTSPGPITPGPTYHVLAQFIELFPQSFIVTQNVDSLVRRVGIPDDRICEIHGSLRSMSCLSTKCGNVQPLNADSPMCVRCGGWCRPDVILFEEDLNKREVSRVQTFLTRTRPQCVVVVGTSMQFGYLDGFISRAKSKAGRRIPVININPDPACVLDVRGAVNWQVGADEGLAALLAHVQKKDT